MALEITQAAKDHLIKMGYDVAYGARPLRRVIQNMIEDVLAEHLLLGRYEPGTTIVVDKTSDEAGLDIHAAEAKTPVEAGRKPRSSRHRSPPERGPDGARPEPLRLPGMWRHDPSLGGPVPLVRGVEHPRRDARAARDERPRVRAASAPSAEPVSLALGRWCRARRRAGRSGSASSTGSWAVGWSTGRWSCSAVSRGSASRRSSSRPPPGSRGRPRRRAASCTPRARSRRVRSGCGPIGWGCSTTAGAAIRVAGRPAMSAASRSAPAPIRPALLVVDSVQTVDRRRARRRRRGAWGRCASHAAPDGAREGRGIFRSCSSGT